MKKNCTNTRIFLEELQRMMIDKGADTLKLDCKIFCAADVTAYIEEVQKWSDEHKEKTYLDDFLEKFPTCRTDKGGCDQIYIHGVCQKDIYGTNQICARMTCTKCWNTVKGETPESGTRKKF